MQSNGKEVVGGGATDTGTFAATGVGGGGGDAGLGGGGWSDAAGGGEGGDVGGGSGAGVGDMTGGVGAGVGTGIGDCPAKSMYKPTITGGMSNSAKSTMQHFRNFQP